MKSHKKNRIGTKKKVGSKIGNKTSSKRGGSISFLSRRSNHALHLPGIFRNNVEGENIGGIIYQSTTIPENEFNNILDTIINLFGNEKLAEEEIQAAGNYVIHTLIYRSNLHGLNAIKQNYDLLGLIFTSVVTHTSTNYGCEDKICLYPGQRDAYLRIFKVLDLVAPYFNNRYQPNRIHLVNVEKTLENSVENLKNSEKFQKWFASIITQKNMDIPPVIREMISEKHLRNNSR